MAPAWHASLRADTLPRLSLKAKMNRFDNFFMVEESEDIEDCSSTLIRERIDQGQSVDDLTFPAVADYLRSIPPRTSTSTYGQ